MRERLPCGGTIFLWERLLPRQARDPELRRRAAAMGEQWQGGLPRQRRASLQRRIVAPLIVESEARPLGGAVVESLGVTPVIRGR